MKSLKDLSEEDFYKLKATGYLWEFFPESSGVYEPPEKEVWIDPPKGHKYGFPKIYKKSYGDMEKWLEKEGYPRSLIDSLGNHFFVRSWNADDSSNT